MSQPANAPALSGARVHENIEDDPRRGFRSYGEFAFAVLQAGLGREPDERLSAIRAASNAPSVYGNENSGADGGVVVDRMMSGTGNSGFDAAVGKYVDLFEAGIIDPTKVVRLALENATSAAGVLLLTEATMTEVREPKGESAGAMPEGMGT